MNLPPLQLPDEAGNVIQLSIVRAGFQERRLREMCTHRAVEIDSALNEVTCLDCKAKLNPVGYLLMLAEEWHRIDNLTKQYREAVTAFEAKLRCRCEHCNRITKVRPPTAAEIREFRKGAG